MKTKFVCAVLATASFLNGCSGKDLTTLETGFDSVVGGRLNYYDKQVLSKAINDGVRNAQWENPNNQRTYTVVINNPYKTAPSMPLCRTAEITISVTAKEKSSPKTELVTACKDQNNFWVLAD